MRGLAPVDDGELDSIDEWLLGRSHATADNPLVAPSMPT